MNKSNSEKHTLAVNIRSLQKFQPIKKLEKNYIHTQNKLLST